LEEDNFKPDCDNIKKNIKSFTEDMLKEEDYKIFLHHVETCIECRNYVRSVDSFSNQLWRLGDVKVPSDFSSTVLFKLTEPVEVPAEDEAPATTKKWMIIAVTFILIAMTVSAGLIGYLKLRQPDPEEVAVAEVPEVSEDTDELQRNVEFEQYDDDDSGFGEMDDSIAFEWDGDAVSEEPSAEAEGSLGPKLVHWHFEQYNKTKELEALRLRRKKRSKESDLRKRKKEKEQAGETSESSEQLNSTIQSLEAEISEVETKIQKNLSDKQRRENEPLGIIQSLDLKTDYQDSDFIFFSTSGDALKRVTDEIALIFPGSSPLDDFTPGVSHLPHKKYQVSVYKVKKETEILHWHVHLSMLNQKLQLMKTIQDSAGMVTYEFAEEVTFSVLRSKVEIIKAQMPAMRISLSEFGNQMDQESGAVDNTVVVSIYFAR